MSKRIVTGLVLAGLVSSLSACAGGGGGGGGSGGGGSLVTTPSTPSTPAAPITGFASNDCTAKANALACSAAALVLAGPSAFVSKSNLSAVASTVGLDAAGSSASISMNAGSRGTSGDETYQWTYNLHGQTQTAATGPKFDTGTRFGMPSEAYVCGDVVSCAPQGLYLLDAKTSETGTLDYVLPFAYFRDSGTSTLVYGVYGRETGAFSPAMQSGTAVYAGAAFGEYGDTSAGTWATSARLWMTSDFSTGLISGSVTDFKGYTPNLSSSNDAKTLTANLDFDFVAAIDNSNGRFVGLAASRTSAGGLSGGVQGSFFGVANTVPEEAGLSYLLFDSSSTRYLVGAAAAGSSPSAAPPAAAVEPPAATQPPPTSSHPAGCVTAVCLTTSTEFFGPSTKISAPGVSSALTSPFIDNVLSSVSVTVNPGASSATSDDTYTVKYIAHGTTYTQTFSGMSFSSDGLGKFGLASGTQGGLNSTLLLADVASAVSGSLDYVQVAAYDRDASLTTAEDAFIVYGRQTAAADMPKSGSAVYRGGTRGLYVNASQTAIFQTASDISMSVNFAAGTMTGQTSNFKFLDSNGNKVTRSEDVNFLFSGQIASGTSRFSGTAISALPSSAGGLLLSGNVEGAFYGAAGKAPDEAGLVYKLGTVSGAYMTGGAAMGKQ